MLQCIHCHKSFQLRQVNVFPMQERYGWRLALAGKKFVLRGRSPSCDDCMVVPFGILQLIGCSMGHLLLQAVVGAR